MCFIHKKLIDLEMCGRTTDKVKATRVNAGTKSETSFGGNKPLAQVLLWQLVAMSCGS